jgi:ketosteroid isomerase-like protein
VQDLHFTVRAVHPTDDGVVLEYTDSSFDVQRGKHLSNASVLIFELEGNAIRRSADYYDFATILAELGLLNLHQATPAATPSSQLVAAAAVVH